MSKCRKINPCGDKGRAEKNLIFTVLFLVSMKKIDLRPHDSLVVVVVVVFCYAL